MKVLYISGGAGQDYMRDCVFLGLRELLGPDVVDVGKLDSLYVGADRSSMYGKGFSLYSELPDIEVDRSDIPAKIAHKFFDLVVYGSIHRCQDYLYEVVSKYFKHQVIAIDGEDHPGYLSGLDLFTFKRELHSSQPDCFSIHFGIPARKILKEKPVKTRLMAPCDPINKKTYIYNDEASYYNQYAESYFGPSMKKAGYDALRNYEILANWCLPYYRCVETIPEPIMHRFPKKELRLVRDAIDYFGPLAKTGILENLWEEIIDPCMKVTREFLTTEAVAKYVLDTICHVRM